MNVIIGIVQALLVVLLAPFVSGMARVIRAKIHTRKGPSIWQDYFDIAKLFKRQDLHSSESSFVHKLMPPLFLGVMLVLSFGIPMIARYAPFTALGDIILIIYLMALPRFFFSLSAVDSGSTYSGVGGVRELLVGVLVEPSMMLALFVAALVCGTTNLTAMGLVASTGGVSSPVAFAIAGIAFACACYVELGKLPYDMAEAEQEIQEGPLQEYSGPSLALVKIGMSMKQILVVSWFIAIFLPWGSALDYSAVSLLVGLVVWLVKLLVIMVICCLFENVVARVRYKFLGQQTWAFVGIAACAFVFCLLGI